ncbi:MAG: dephospho-CoA kinase [Casimicrobiaceae bacterium]
MFVVGLTGGIGSGKTTVSDALARLGAAIIDADAVSRELTAPGGEAVSAIVEAFPEATAGPDRIDRARLREITFSDATARARLEAILHPRIAARIDHVLSHPTDPHAPYTVLVVPLLVEKQTYLSRCHAVVVVDAPTELQLTRAASRPGMTRDQVRRIIDAQTSRDLRLAHAQFVLANDSTLDSLERQIAKLHLALVASARWHHQEGKA